MMRRSKHGFYGPRSGWYREVIVTDEQWRHIELALARSNGSTLRAEFQKCFEVLSLLELDGPDHQHALEGTERLLDLLRAFEALYNDGSNVGAFTRSYIGRLGFKMDDEQDVLLPSEYVIGQALPHLILQVAHNLEELRAQSGKQDDVDIGFHVSIQNIIRRLQSWSISVPPIPSIYQSDRGRPWNANGFWETVVDIIGHFRDKPFGGCASANAAMRQIRKVAKHLRDIDAAKSAMKNVPDT